MVSLSPCLHCKCRAGSYPSLTLFMWSASRFLPPAACLAACTASPSLREASQATHSPNDALKRKAVYSWIKVTRITHNITCFDLTTLRQDQPQLYRISPRFTATCLGQQRMWTNGQQHCHGHREGIGKSNCGHDQATVAAWRIPGVSGAGAKTLTFC